MWGVGRWTMAEILRVKINWTGFVGGPGYTNLYFRDFTEGATDQAMADGAVAKTKTFLTSVQNYLPTAVITGVDPTVDRLEETTGELQGFFTTSPGAAVAGGQAGVYSAASGACISWGTNGVRNGRRIRGRTFIVPLGGSQYGSDGTLSDTMVTALRNAATALRAETGAGDLGIWARPTAPGAADGVWYFATTSNVKDKVAILRSRRD